MEKKSNNIILWIIIGILLGAVIVLSIKLLQNRETHTLFDSTNSQNSTNNEISKKEEKNKCIKFATSSTKEVLQNSLNDKNVIFNVSTLDGTLAYSVDYGANLPKDSMTFREYVSDQAMSVLLNGYPSKYFEELGVATPDEAYFATQIAFWEIMNRTGESKNSTEMIRAKELTALEKNEDAFNRIVATAQKLVELAETDPYGEIPTMNINNSKIALTDIESENKESNEAYIGPYIINVSGVDSNNIKVIKASLVDAPESAMITDSNGNEKNILTNNDVVYVKMDKSEKDTSFNIKFDAYVDRVIGSIYQDKNNSTQDFAKLEIVPNSMEKELTINWSKVSSIGIIELNVVDSKQKPVVNASFELIDSSNNILGEITTGKDGKVDFYSVPVGDYTLKQISTPDGYEIKEETKNVTVESGKTIEVTFEN